MSRSGAGPTRNINAVAACHYHCRKRAKPLKSSALYQKIVKQVKEGRFDYGPTGFAWDDILSGAKSPTICPFGQYVDVLTEEV
jgi:hypothetical protein